MHWLVGTILAHHIMHISQMLADFLTHCQKNRIHWYCHIGKDCRHWDTVKLIMTDNKFPDFCLSAQIYHWHQTLSVVFLEVTAWLCKFSRKCCQTPNVNNHNLSVSHLFQVKMVFHEKKKATSLYNSHTHFLKTTVPLQDATKLIYAYFLSAILTIKNCVLKQEHLIQWILLTASKTISGKTAFFFFYCKYLAVKNTMTITTFSASALNLAEMWAVLPCTAFAPSGQMRKQWKGQINC